MAEQDSTIAKYTGQSRGEKNDYDRYFAGMDSTMRQKLAFIGAHFLLRPGASVADMGCGSGLGSFQLAQLNPHVRVLGIDINPAAVAFAREKYRLPNLRFEIGDIEVPDPALGPFDGILNSSVQHHVYTFNGYNPARVANALRNQIACLNDGGQMLMRDFVAWPADRYVLMDVSGVGKGNTIMTMSDAELLIRFSETARPLTPEKGTGFFLEEVKAPHDGDWHRFRLSAKYAAEFLLRKDYRRDWEIEVLEEYGWWTAEDHRRELPAMGVRLVYSAPYFNPWIHENRWRGKVRLFDEAGGLIDLPPTNFISVAEKVTPEESLWVGERSVARTPRSYLFLSSQRNAETGEIYDMAARPGAVDDVLPFQTGNDGTLRIFAKHGYPRPIINTVPRGTPVLDGKQWSGHVTEILSIADTDGMAGEDKKAILARRMNIGTEALGDMAPDLAYYPSAGQCDEFVSASFVEVTGDHAHHAARIDPAVSGFSTAGDVRTYRAQDILRAAQVGMLAEARLELNTYRLMQRCDITPDVWIGAAMPEAVSGSVSPVSLDRLLSMPPQQRFSPSDTAGNYLRHLRSVFADVAQDKENARREYEFILPGKPGTSTNVLSVLFLSRAVDGEICAALQRFDLPAPQAKEGDSGLVTLPVYRLPAAVTSIEGVARFSADKFGVPQDKVRQLGEGYFSSVGMTPERVFPFAVAVDPAKLPKPLPVVPLREIFCGLSKLRDAHLMIAGMRAVHALGKWDEFKRTGAGPAP